MNPNYKSGINRFQFFSTSLDLLLPPDNDARVIDAFVNSLDISNFKHASTKKRGNKPYDPRCLLKIYLLGYLRSIRSSRKLEYALNTNIEFIWISNNLSIKHTTINDFRKDNHKLLKDIMIKFNLSLNDFNLISSIDSQDGTKLKAVNSKDNNFTLNKLDDRISRASKSVDEFENAFNSEDTSDVLKEQLQNKINEYNNKIEEFKQLQKQIIDSGSSQISLIDPSSKLMKNNEKFEVCYNNQVAVDTKSHIVKDFLITNNPADLGSIYALSSNIKNIYKFDLISNITDKGYNDRSDMLNCLENAIIPHVTPPKGKSSFSLETDFEDYSISNDMIESSNPDDIKKCLRAAVIPKIYDDLISDIQVVEKNIFVDDNVITPDEDDNFSDDDRRDFAIANNCFVRNIKDQKVFCPMGEILRKKCSYDNKIRFCNKLACKNCKNPCTPSKFKVIDFSTNQTISGKNVNKSKKKRKKIKVKKVIFNFTPNPNLLKIRMATSEHPHASLKFWDNSRFLLLKGIDKVTGEMSLYYCAYNIRRAINLLGHQALINYFIDKNKVISSIISYIFNYFYNFFVNNYFFS